MGRFVKGLAGVFLFMPALCMCFALMSTSMPPILIFIFTPAGLLGLYYMISAVFPQFTFSKLKENIKTPILKRIADNIIPLFVLSVFLILIPCVLVMVFTQEDVPTEARVIGGIMAGVFLILILGLFIGILRGKITSTSSSPGHYNFHSAEAGPANAKGIPAPKGSKWCDYCNGLIDDDAKFCPQCGKELWN